MNIISVINLKGGVGKSITAINLAYMLSKVKGKNVLLIDNDKQGNTTKFFSLHSYKKPSIADVLENKNYDILTAIRPTIYSNLHVLPANMNLNDSNKSVLLDSRRQQQTILQEALKPIQTRYEYCIIDNAPDINISVINALVASNNVIVPAKIDKFTFDGIQQLIETFDEIRVFNPDLDFTGVLITMLANNKANKEGAQWLNESQLCPVFSTKISRSVKVDESTFHGVPLLEYSPKCKATLDYLAFLEELLEKI